ncbi:MAG: glycosyltransferase [Eubacterium sp.]|nr:glycosyltransferase [Eubacterium sp.]
MKILMVAGSMHVGGIENQLMHLMRNVDKNKFHIDFTSDMPEAFYREEIEALGGNFLLLENKCRNHPLKYCRELYRIMREGKYDIVHAHELFHCGITVFVAALAGVPCRFTHAHNWREGDDESGKYSLIRRSYQSVMRTSIRLFSTTQIACSTWAGKFLYGKKCLKKKSYHLVFNSVDTTKYLDKFDCIEEGDFIEKDGWKNVINVARVSKVKNQVFLVDIAKELKKRNKKIRILCVGDGDDDEMKQRMMDEIKESQLSEYIYFLGVRKDVDALLRKCSAFILPSKYEGMPLVMIEAQATGLPCISADTYSREVDFEIGKVKWIPLTEGVETWADSIEAAVEMEKAIKSEVVNAIENKGFDSKIFTKKICELYEKDYRRKREKNN